MPALVCLKDSNRRKDTEGAAQGHGEAHPGGHAYVIVSNVHSNYIRFTVSEKVNPRQLGGTKPRVHWTGNWLRPAHHAADVMSIERTAGLPKKQS